MRTEEEVREFYRQYVYRYAVAAVDGNNNAGNQYLGAAFAYGRTLERSMAQITNDLESTKAQYQKEYDLEQAVGEDG